MTLREQIRYNRLGRIHYDNQTRWYAFIASIVEETFRWI
jgi:hypothetical protein